MGAGSAAMTWARRGTRPTESSHESCSGAGPAESGTTEADLPERKAIELPARKPIEPDPPVQFDR